MTSPQKSGKQSSSRNEPAVTAALEPGESAAELVRVLDDYLAGLQAGKPADRTAVLAAHPELASQLEQCLAGIEFIHRAGRTAGELPAQLGDFRIRGEIGRGGMGVVYEAEQLSLHRTVALKILRFGAVADGEALNRFRNEAETVARLHHTNIVPIFAVGCEQGVNFYAMQFIHGQSLADVIQRKSCYVVQNGSEATNVLPLPLGEGTVFASPSAEDVAGWGLQAAEALAHAHGRGVIHRDIKPSNLLLDNEGTLWLTDFGLAKRIDEVTLTLTGAILGTPRYMSPEQAASTRQPVDHRTDIYSLGATLYEVATGQPVFAAATPHEVISQIIAAEPRSPRNIDRSVPRDLETIILKCLAKEPARRYQTARELADDLRAFLEGRPIGAWRLSVLARTTRWVKKRWKTAAAMAAVAACVAALFVGGFLAWRLHEESLLGHLSLTTSGPTLVAEVLDKDDRPVVPSFPVPSSQPVALREGAYQVRLSSPGMLSQTYPLEVERGSHYYFDPRLEDRWMWPPMELKPDERIEPVRFGAQTDLLVYRQSDSSLRRLDGATGKPVWPQDLTLDKSNLPAGDDLDEWKTLLQAPYFDPWLQSWLAESTVDLGRDGAADLIFASRKKPALVAVSGKTGKVLWLFRGRPMPDSVKDLSGLQPVAGNSNDAPVIGRPVVAESAGEDASRVVGCFFSFGESYRRSDGSTVAAPEQTWLEAVSGKSGASLWRHPFRKTLKFPSYDQWAAALEAIGQPQIARIGERKVVLSAINATLYGVDLATGKEAWPPLELGFTPDAAPQIVDLGNGQSEALFSSGQPHNGTSGQAVKLTLTAISLDDRRKLWEAPIDAISRPQFNVGMSTGPGEIAVERLGPKIEPAIVTGVCHIGEAFRHEPAGLGWGHTNGRFDLVVLDAATGKPRWEKVLYWFRLPEPIRWLVGPDLDGDGYREVFVAWTDYDRPGGSQLVVAALSGRDGRTLWRWTLDGVGNDNSPQPPMRWWQPAENGQPQLLVPVARAPGGQPATYILDSANGHLRQTLLGVSDPRTCDLDGDGLADLLYTIPPQGFPRLMAVRGAPPSVWRRLDQQPLKVAQDFDGDGITDAVMVANGPWRSDTAISGRDGRILRRSLPRRMNGNPPAPVSAPLPLGDLGGDGHPAVVALVDSASDRNLRELAAFSGIDGRQLWPTSGSSSFRVEEYSTGVSSSRYHYEYPALAFGSFVRHKQADVLAAVPDARQPGRTIDDSRVWLNVLSGDSGKLRWTAAVAKGQFGENGRVYQTEFQDLNGDGVADVVAWVRPADGQAASGPCELRAFNGVDGTPLWTDAPPIYGPPGNGMIDLPTIGDLEGKGAADVIFVRQLPWDNQARDPDMLGTSIGGTPSEVVAVGGRDGRVKWKWSWVGASDAALPPLLVDFDGAGRHSVCQVITGLVSYNNQLVVLDGAGKLRRRIRLSKNWLRAADLHGDSKEALLVYTGGQLQALGGAKLEPEWSWSVPTQDADLIDILPAEGANPATVVVWAGQSVFGLSGTSGRPRWRGEMPGSPPNSNDGEPARVLLRDRNGLGLPRLLAGDGCRLTWPVDEQGRYQPPHGEPVAYAPLHDPVWVRPLPWVPGGYDYPGIPLAVLMVPWTLLWFVVPVLLIRWAMKRNSWRLAFVPAFYQLAMTLALRFIPMWWLPFNTRDWRDWDPHVGICFLSVAYLIVHAAWMVRGRLWALVDASAIYAIAIAIGWSQRVPRLEGDQFGSVLHFPVPASIVNMLSVISGGLPLIAAVALTAIWLRRRQWIRLGLFMLASIALAAGFAMLQLQKDAFRKAADEEYAMDGWYLILVYGVYLAVCLVPLGWVGKHGFRWCRRAVSRVFSRFSKKPVA